MVGKVAVKTQEREQVKKSQEKIVEKIQELDKVNKVPELRDKVYMGVLEVSAADYNTKI